MPSKVTTRPPAAWALLPFPTQVIQLLGTVKSKFPASKGALSWSDLIVFAGTTAIIEAGGKMMPFCPGRTDAKDGGSRNPFRDWYPDPFTAARDNMKVMGLTAREMVALQVMQYIRGRPCSTLRGGAQQSPVTLACQPATCCVQLCASPDRAGRSAAIGAHCRLSRLMRPFLFSLCCPAGAPPQPHPAAAPRLQRLLDQQPLQVLEPIL